MRTADIEGIYLEAITIKEDVKEEKMTLMANFLYVLMLMQNKFYDNPNIINAIDYVKMSFMQILEEADLEHELVIKIVDYIEKHNFELDDEKVDELDSILRTFEGLCDSRLLYSVELSNYYEEIIKGGILTNMNYYVKTLPERISETNKKKMLSYLGVEYEIR